LTYYRYDPEGDKQVRHHVDYRFVVFSEDMRMLTLEEASARCGLSVEQLNEAISLGKLRLRSVEDRKLILLAELNEYIARS
jgi:DNA-directed RNA polymerase specialized sigma24 family protein